MTNGRPMILSTADAITLQKRMDMLNTQLKALLDGMAGAGQAIESLLKGYEELEARIGRLGDNLNAITQERQSAKPLANNQSGVVNG